MTSLLRPPCDEGVMRAAPPPARKGNAPLQEGWILAATILGSSLAFIDGTVVNVALPVMQVKLHATLADMQWVVEGYALFLSALLLVGGSLGDHLGRRRVFALGVALFALASVWCGLAPSVTQLILARCVQGVGGALLTPGSLAILSAAFDGERRGKAIGTWSGWTAITSAVGPLLGGWLVQYASWRGIFFINIPLALIVLFLTFRYVPESRDDRAGKTLDWMGAVLATLGLGGVVYGLIVGQGRGWGSPTVWGPSALGLLALVAFVWVENHSASPMMPPALFRSRTFSGANALTLLLYAALGGLLFFLPYDLQGVQHYSPTATGAALLPFTVVLFALSRWAGGLVARYGAKIPLTVGPLIAAAGFALFTRPGLGGSYWTTWFPAVSVLALGMAVSVAPLTTAVMGAVEDRYSGAASGINNAVSRTAGLIAVAAFGLLLTSVFRNDLAAWLPKMDIPISVQQKIVAQSSRLTDIRVPDDVWESVRPLVKEQVDQSFILGFRWVMRICAALAVLSAACAWLLIDGKASSKRN